MNSANDPTMIMFGIGFLLGGVSALICSLAYAYDTIQAWKYREDDKK